MARSPILSLPVELLAVVTKCLTEIRDINALALTHRTFHILVRSQQLHSVCFGRTLKSSGKEHYLSQAHNAFLCTFIRRLRLVSGCLSPKRMDLVRKVLSQSSQIEHWELELAGPFDFAGCRIPSLRSLQISTLDICSPGLVSSVLPILRQCAGTIETLAIPVAEGCLEILRGMPALKRFRMTCPAPELLEAVVEALPSNLVSIGLVGTTMEKSAITAICRFPSLEEADLAGNDWSINHSWMRSELRNFSCLKRLTLLGKWGDVVWHVSHPRREREIWSRAGRIVKRLLEAEAETYIDQLPGLESIRLTGRFPRRQHPDVTVIRSRSPCRRCKYCPSSLASNIRAAG